jgi:hypothetical protein
MPTTSKYPTKAERDAAHAARMTRMDASFERLEAERSQVRLPVCNVCEGLKWVSPANADPAHVRLVPCPACGDRPPAPETSALEEVALIDWYSDHQIDPSAQSVMDMGDELYGD